MSESYIPLVAGFVGALIGALTSIITIVIQTRIQDKRQRLQATIQVALENYRLHIDMIKASNQKATMYPVVLYLHYYLELMELMDKNRLTERNLQELFEENRRVRQMLEKWTIENP